LLASCGFDKKVIIWKEMSQNNWEMIFEYIDHKNSVNSIAFCPHEYGLILLCGSSDGFISLHEYKSNIFFILDDHWTSKKFEAHSQGVTSVSWGPALNPITFDKDEINSSNNQLAPMRFVTGGCDNNIKVWTFPTHINLDNIEEQNFAEKIKTENLEGHKDWVRDVAWLNYVGYANDTIATCSEVY
jgi:protein transport protein SEC13